LDHFICGLAHENILLFSAELEVLIREKDYCLLMDFTLGAGLRNLDGPILITGHTGFKGTWLSLLLEKMEIDCVGVSLPPTADSLFSKLDRRSQAPGVLGDIRDISFVREVFKLYKPSAVIHLAAQPLVIESYKNPIETFETNVMGTVNVLDTGLRNQSTKGIVVVTTDKVYRNDNSGKKFMETDPLFGKDPYSASKVGSEAAIAAWQQISNSLSNVSISSVRAGNVIGGGDWAENRLLPDLMRGFINRQDVEIRNPNSTRPWQHVLDPLLGYLHVLEAGIVSSNHFSYNFGPQEGSLSVKQVANIAKSRWGDGAEYHFAVSPAADLKEATTLDLDVNLAINNLNWLPTWNQVEAIELTVDWWKKVADRELSAKEACCSDIDIALKNLRRYREVR